jgi:hypothetical protein
MLRIIRHVGMIATAILLMASTALAQPFCPDLDRVVTLAPSGFRSILDEASRGAIETGVTLRLPGASACWYDNSTGAYWCMWNEVPLARVEDQVKQLASFVGQCYQVQPSYETPSGGNEIVAFVDVPNDVSIYINGVGETVAMSIRKKDTVGHFDNGTGISPLVGDQPAKPATP